MICCQDCEFFIERSWWCYVIANYRPPESPMCDAGKRIVELVKEIEQLSLQGINKGLPPQRNPLKTVPKTGFEPARGYPTLDPEDNEI